MAQYICTNIGNCTKADQRETILDSGINPRCPECRSTISLDTQKPPLPKWLLLGGGVLLVSILGGIAYALLRPTPPTPTPVPVPTPIPTPIPAPLQATTLLRFHGSNTIGSTLLPALANAFLKQEEGCKNIETKKTAKEEEIFIVGEQCNSGHPEQIEIHAHGSSTAFTDLKEDLCDIGMSSRKIKEKEKEELLPTLGDLTSNASEHVLALDAIALIVHPSNTIKTLSVAQVADIFSGALTDWSQVGGKAGTITLYARDDKSGTYDFFKDSVLKANNKTLAPIPDKQRFEDSDTLSKSVSADPNGIGFIGLNYIGINKVVALSDAGVEARKPTEFTVKTEDYILSRRLYLYTAEKPSNPNVFKFIEFAVGSAAQPIIKPIAINLDPTPIPKTPDERKNDPRSKSARWGELTSNAIDEIPTRFRFRFGSSELDPRANRDVGRIVGILEQEQKYKGRPLLLIGFADSKGTPTANCKVSQDRADIMKRELAVEGLTIEGAIGLCEEAPVAPNTTPENMEKNRRVEVWIK